MEFNIKFPPSVTLFRCFSKHMGSGQRRMCVRTRSKTRVFIRLVVRATLAPAAWHPSMEEIKKKKRLRLKWWPDKTRGEMKLAKVEELDGERRRKLPVKCANSPWRMVGRWWGSRMLIALNCDSASHGFPTLRPLTELPLNNRHVPC